MTMTRFGLATAMLAVSTLASSSSAHADDKKPAPPAMAAPAPAAAPAMKPAPAPAAAPAMKPVAAPAPAMAKPAPAAAPAAPAAAAPAMPTPPKELEAFMKGFEGSWKCETKFAAGAMGPGSPEATGKTTVKFKKEFGGFSWHGEYAMAKSKTMPASSGVMQVGYDTGSNQLTIVGYDSMGGAMFGAGAISGDSAIVTEEGYMMGMKMKVRETMTKTGPKEVHHKYEADMGKGFQVMAEDSCKK